VSLAGWPSVEGEGLNRKAGHGEMRVVLIGGRTSAWRDSARGLRSLQLPLPRQLLCLEDLGRRHLWPLMRQFVSNGIK